MLYSKNGSIPYPYTDDTDGWVQVPDKPEAPEGKEVVWWFPPGWVIRDPKPETREGYEWSWFQSEEKWVEYKLKNPQEETIDIPALSNVNMSQEELDAAAKTVAMSTHDVVIMQSSQVQSLSSAELQSLDSLQIESLSTSQISGLE